MNKILALPLLAICTFGILGCTDVQSIPSSNLYITVSEKNMPYYCKQQIAKYSGVFENEIQLYPVEYEKGLKVVYGKYSVDSKNIKEFVCIFNGNDTYAGIKMEGKSVSNKLCYTRENI